MDVNFDAISGLPNTYDYLNNSTAGISMLVVAVGVLVIYYILFAALGAVTPGGKASQGVGQGKSDSAVAIEVIMWSVFILLLIFNALQYFLSINVNASLKNLFTKEPEIDLTIDMPYVKHTGEDKNIHPSDSIPEITYEKQAYHVPGNNYTYDDATAICEAYGSRLANYNDLEKTYKKGGEWCSYGWSEGQMALYPTQEKTWGTLQNIKGHEHDCGRPGINGGFIGNPNVRFGINCFGYKPKITPEEQELMENTTPFPKTQKELNFEKNVKNWKMKLPEILVAPFNAKEWSKP
jgi:hypothetical protein